MIPRLIHQIFLGSWPYSELNNRCHATWRKVLPDFEIKYWTRHTLPAEAKPPWVQRALANPGPGSGSNAGAFAKYWLLHRFGGVYFDNDIELLKPVELNHACWLGWQRDGKDADINTSAYGCEPGHWFNEVVMARILERPVDDHPLAFGPLLFTAILRERGLHGQNVEQHVQDVKVYSKEKYYPWFWDEKPETGVTENTIAKHHWEGTWK